MTREEAIAFFKDMNECTYGNLEAVEMAIKALEQEPCEDCISREAVKAYKYHRTMYPNFEDYVDMLPPVTPQPRWIPVSERLPKEHISEDGYVEPSDMVQITTAHGTVTTSRYWGNRWSKVTEEAEGRSPEYYDWVEAELWEDDVLAWMPLPQPYK